MKALRNLSVSIEYATKQQLNLYQNSKTDTAALLSFQEHLKNNSTLHWIGII